MFDEYFNPSTIVVSPVLVADAPRAVDTTESPMSRSIDLDALSTSMPSTQEQKHSLNISQGFEESPKIPHFHNDPLHESLHKDSTSQGSSSNGFTREESISKESFTSVARLEAIRIFVANATNKNIDDLPNGRQNAFLNYDSKKSITVLTRRKC
ncbi:hypothetical protein Tco_0783104 [Tanacetum coccineum]